MNTLRLMRLRSLSVSLTSIVIKKFEWYDADRGEEQERRRGVAQQLARDNKNGLVGIFQTHVQWAARIKSQTLLCKQ
jgi:hypothetical protein